jgi:hypothetical protein
MITVIRSKLRNKDRLGGYLHHAVDTTRSDQKEMGQMKISTLSVIAFVLLTLFLYGCAPNSEPVLPELTPSPEIPTSTPEPTHTPTMTPTVTPSPTPTATPVGGSGMLYFNVFSDIGHMGVFAYDLGSLTLTRITDEGVRIAAVSPRGHKILLVRDEQLITANPDGSDHKIIAENLSGEGWVGALWIPDTDRVLFVGRDQGQDFIYSIREDGEDLLQISQQGMNILELYETHSSSLISWEQGYCTNAGCWSEGLWLATIDGSNPVSLENINNPVFSPSGDRIIAKKLVEINGIWQDAPFIMAPDLSGEVQLVNPLGDLMSPNTGIFTGIGTYFWIEGGRKIFAEWGVYDSINDEETSHYYLFTESGDLDGEVQIAGLESESIHPYFVAVSPDGLTIADVAFQQNGEEVPSYIRLIDLNSFSVTPLELSLPEGSTRIFGKIYWLPR